MKALVKTADGPGNLELKDVPEPTCAPDGVVIAVKAAGICGTDLHIRAGGFPTRPPVIIGHEFAGEIAEVGAEVTGWAVGDRVVAEPHRGGCGVCRYCQTGSVEVCAEKRAIGYKVDGCFTELVDLPAARLHRLPDHVTFEQAALTEPLAVGVKAALQRTRVEPEDVAVVTGCGPIGLLAAGAVKAAGARAVVVTGTPADVDVRLKAALDMGIDRAVDVVNEDLGAVVDDLSGGAGADLVVEATGVSAAIAQGFDILRIDGRMACIGITGRDEVAIPWDLAMKKAARITFSYSTNWVSWEQALSLIGSGRVRVDEVISGTCPLEDWEQAFDRLERLEAIKIVLTMG